MTSGQPNAFDFSSVRAALRLRATALLTCVLMGSALPHPAAAQQVVRIGFSDSPPISYRNPSSGTLEGLAVSVFAEVAKLAGLEQRPELMSFGALLPALTDAKVDLATMSGTPERRRVAIFSDPFVRYGETLLVRANDLKDYVAIDQLKGKRIGSNAGGGWLQAAQDAGGEVFTFPGAEQSLQALEDGRLDAVIGNAPTYIYLMRTKSYPNVRVVRTYVAHQTNELAFAARPGDTALIESLNVALKKMDHGSQLADLRKHWGF